MSHLIVNGVDKTLDHIKIKAVVKGLSEPLCGIGTYKDTLDLSTGTLTWYVKKLVLTGQENFVKVQNRTVYYLDGLPTMLTKNVVTAECSHYVGIGNVDAAGNMVNNSIAFRYSEQRLYIRDDSIPTQPAFATFLATQYAAGTPVTVWYVLAETETEQIAVPSHLTGTIEGYLTRTVAPSPTNPIYPTANGEEESGGTYSIDTGEYIEAWEARTRVILHGLTNPLCGIGTYKDTLDLSTGVLTRYVKKLVLTGEENITQRDAPDNSYSLNLVPSGYSEGLRVNGYCTHFPQNSSASSMTDGTCYCGTTAISFRMNSVTDVNSFKSYLAAQYANGHPVTVWYVLATPTTETITVPSNLTGMVEGYLTQTGTPTPTNPIYPTSNGTLEQGGTYSLDTGAYAIAWGRTDTFTGTNSISARCYGLPVKSWEIDGNSQQTGTPAPDNIIVPTFCGVRTANLVDIRTFQDGMHLDATTGLPTPFGGDRIATIQPIDVSQYSNVKLTFSETTQSALFMYSLFNGDTLIERVASKYSGTTIDTSNATKMYLSLYSCTVSDVIYIMLNAGNSALPYEPYGYKLPITSAGQTTPIYLGEVQTVRRVKKLVLTGTEYWDKGTYAFNSYLADSKPYNSVLCTHYVYYNGLSSQAPVNSISTGSGTGSSIWIKPADYGNMNVDDWKTYLAQQYTNGTPVTVWYVLATPTTGIVNEPLAKIGEYADELHSADAGVTIPTTNGNNTISVDTSLTPSRFEIKVHAKPI